jgi:hypothetical protein
MLLALRAVTGDLTISGVPALALAPQALQPRGAQSAVFPPYYLAAAPPTVSSSKSPPRSIPQVGLPRSLPVSMELALSYHDIKPYSIRVSFRSSAEPTASWLASHYSWWPE